MNGLEWLDIKCTGIFDVDLNYEVVKVRDGWTTMTSLC